MLRSSQRPILPNTEDRTISIPGRHGAWDFGADLAPKQFDLDCAFIGLRNSRELQTAVDRLARHLVDERGNPRTMRLTFDHMPGKYYMARYSGQLPIERAVGQGGFTLPLVAYDPFAYANDERIYEDVIKVSPYTSNVESNGNVRTSPIIVLTNEGSTTITNFKITNEYRLE